MKTPGSAEGAAPARTRTFARRLSLALVALVFAAFAASALAGSHGVKGSFRFDSTITSTDPIVTNPPNSNGAPSCTTSTAVSNPTATYRRDVYSFRNISGTVQCVTVSLAVSAGSAEAMAFVPSFNQATMNADFFGDTGSAVGPGEARGFSFNASCFICLPDAPETFDVVVRDAGSVPATYTLLVEGTGIIMVGSGPTATASLQSFSASAAPKGVLVRWKTRSEHDALGFNLYRGGVKKVRLTRSLVRASGGGRGHTYSYIDHSARKGKAAPYYLEVVQRSGSKIMFGPALRTAR